MLQIFFLSSLRNATMPSGTKVLLAAGNVNMAPSTVVTKRPSSTIRTSDVNTISSSTAAAALDFDFDDRKIPPGTGTTTTTTAASDVTYVRTTAAAAAATTTTTTLWRGRRHRRSHSDGTVILMAQRAMRKSRCSSNSDGKKSLASRRGQSPIVRSGLHFDLPVGIVNDEDLNPELSVEEIERLFVQGANQTTKHGFGSGDGSGGSCCTDFRSSCANTSTDSDTTTTRARANTAPQLL